MAPVRSADVVVVGAGIVGTAVAAHLSDHGQVLVLDAGPEDLAGSTGHAPGYVGEFGGSSIATRLATSTTDGLEALADERGAVLERTGCLEVATSDAGAEALVVRREEMLSQGIQATLLEPDVAAQLTPETVDEAHAVATLHVPRDAVADARGATRALRGRAFRQGARFEWGSKVTAVEVGVNGVVVDSTAGRVEADHLVLCPGAWASPVVAALGITIPVVAVRHPYVHGPTDVTPPGPRPFVRFHEHHLYARWHGERWGFGTYDHAPDPVDMTDLGRADLPWDGRFDAVVERGRSRFARPELFAPVDRLDGIFAVTPDNLPLVGRLLDDAPVWTASAVWVTHALGAARVAADQVLGRAPTIGDVSQLEPRRFDDLDPELARDRAMRHYNDIYARG